MTTAVCTRRTRQAEPSQHARYTDTTRDYAVSTRGRGSPAAADSLQTQRQQANAEVNFPAMGHVPAFTAIAMVNTLAMSVSARVREFALLRLAGATRRQVLRMLDVDEQRLARAGGLVRLPCLHARVPRTHPLEQLVDAQPLAAHCQSSGRSTCSRRSTWPVRL